MNECKRLRARERGERDGAEIDRDGSDSKNISAPGQVTLGQLHGLSGAHFTSSNPTCFGLGNKVYLILATTMYTLSEEAENLNGR